jgi:molybdopterin molybdotransferase
MISVIEAQEIVDQRVRPLDAEEILLADVHGRVLREMTASNEEMPPFDRSAMDGYAIRSDDAGDEFEAIGEIRAGDAMKREIGRGETIRIFTGAQMPGEDLKVVMQEHVEASGQRIRLLQRSPASNVRKRGEDAKAGEILLQAGATLDATAVALLASMGKASVSVSKRLSILHVTTGDEIVPLETTPKEGQIRNSNASLVSALCRELGIDGVRHIHLGDNFNVMLDMLKKANIKTYDIVLFSGGSGNGAYDFSAKIFETLGATLHFRQVNVRPGKPLIFATNTSQVLFGLPGNVLSHHVCFHLFVRRAIDLLLGRHAQGMTKGFLVDQMDDTLNTRETWWPARTSFADGRIECRAVSWKSSGDITRLPAANALLKVPASTPLLSAGTLVELLITRSF